MTRAECHLQETLLELENRTEANRVLDTASILEEEDGKKLGDSMPITS